MILDNVRGLVRPVVTILLTAAIVLYAGVGITIPDQLWALATLVLGFWFGSRVTKP